LEANSAKAVVSNRELLKMRAVLAHKLFCLRQLRTGVEPWSRLIQNYGRTQQVREKSGGMSVVQQQRFDRGVNQGRTAGMTASAQHVPIFLVFRPQCSHFAEPYFAESGRITGFNLL
jgi:hypothetical protein